MLFNSYPFLIGFLPAALLVMAVVPRFGPATASLAAMLLLSAAFYAYSSVHFLGLLLGSILVNYALSVYVPARRWLVAAAVAFNLGLLGLFKYAGFFTREVAALGIPVAVVSLALPLAISFYTFKQISYVVDIGSGRIKRPPLLRYAAYVSFFPHLIAGPIVRYSELAGRLARAVPFVVTGSGLRLGLVLLIIGLGKKVVLADRFAVIADAGFATVGTLSFLDAWTTVLAFSLQIYFDFSGYSDMAIGLARMFGIRLPDNFNRPYRAVDIAEFWHRWHMSLSRFLRDYFYIPLGGNRRSPGRTAVNLMVVMTIGGLWHGANWTFVVWGGLHGAYLVIHRIWRSCAPFRLPRPLAWLLTFVAVEAAWSFFRSADVREGAMLAGRLFRPDTIVLPARLETVLGHWPVFDRLSYGLLFIGGAIQWAYIVLGLAVVLAMPTTKSLAVASRGRARWALPLGLLLGLCAILLREKPHVFIYFNF